MISNQIHCAKSQAHNSKNEPQQSLDHCSGCPHSSDCQQVGACLDDVNAEYLATRPNQFPRLMTPAQATTFMNRLREGQAVRRMTKGGNLGKAVCSLKKFKKHCAAYPHWGAEAIPHRIASIKALDAWIAKGNRDQEIIPAYPARKDPGEKPAKKARTR